MPKRIQNAGLIMLGIFVFVSCKKDEDHPPVSTLQELHYRMYDSVHRHREGSGLHTPPVYTYSHTPIQRVDTIWRDTTVARPFIIYRSDTLFKDGMYSGPAPHTMGPYFYVLLTNDSISTYNIIDQSINHGDDGNTLGFRVP